MNRTMEQRRALHAMNFVTNYRGDKTKLSTHVQKTPIRILQNGLGQALAFLLSDNEGKTGNSRQPAGHLYDHLQEWLCGAESEDYPGRVYGGQGPNLIKQLMEGSRSDYMRAQDEALKLFTWLKKFSDAYLGGEAKDAEV